MIVTGSGNYEFYHSKLSLRDMGALLSDRSIKLINQQDSHKKVKCKKKTVAINGEPDPTEPRTKALLGQFTHCFYPKLSLAGALVGAEN